MENKNATLKPIVVGGSVIGIKYKDGVMFAVDTAACYGSMIRYTDLQRVRGVGSQTMIAASGEYSDFQEVMKQLEALRVKEWVNNNEEGYDAPSISTYLTRLLYKHRCKIDPLYNTILIGGYNNNNKYLGYVDLYGTTYTDDVIATGFGSYIATPYLRKIWREDLTEQEAEDTLKKCMDLLFMRSCKSFNKVIISKVTEQGVVINEPITVSGNWFSDYLIPTSDTPLAACSW